MSGNKESVISDHRFCPNRTWFDRCVACGYAESAHAETSLPDSRFPDGHDELPYRCPNCVTTGAETCEHGRTTVPPDGEMENPYPAIEGGDEPTGYTDPRWRAWQEGFSAGSGHLEVIAAKAFAAGRAAATPDPPTCRCPDDWRYDDGSVFCPQHQTKPDAHPTGKLLGEVRAIARAARLAAADREASDGER